MHMGRPRKDGQKDLPPGLYLYPDRDAYIKMKGMRVGVEIGTRDREEAIKLYWAFKHKWDAARAGKQAAEVIAKLNTVADLGDTGPSVSAYAKNWRETFLSNLLKAKGGKPLSKETREAYGRMLENQVEPHDEFKTLSLAGARTRDVRKFLSKWIGKPNYYNYVLSLLSRMFQQAVDEGKLEENPVKNVNRRPVVKREVYCPMDHYLAITKHMIEWEARACDLVYLVSHRPGDVLSLRDELPHVRYETRKGRHAVVLTFTATKNDQAMEIVDYVDNDGGIQTTLEWFRQYKSREFDIYGPHIVVYPSGVRFAGKPISRAYLSRRFAAAVIASGLGKGKYKLRDLRKKGLTDEARKAGKATNKGGHKTQEMREYYVVGGIKQRARNNLQVLRGPAV